MSKIKLNIKCMLCEKVYEVEVDEERYLQYMKGEGHIQDLLPELSADDRELIISNICSKCYDDIFREDEEEDDEEYQGEVHNS